MSTLFGVPVDAVYHIVFALTSLLTPVLGGLAAVAGIVVITAAVRLLVSPLTFRALRGQAAQARLAPELQRLRQRYGKQPERLQRELTALYQREGTSMFAGFTPLLIQWPVFSVLYLLFRSPTVGGGANQLLSRDLLGVPLGSHWLSGAGVLSGHGAVFIGVLGVLAAACWLAARTARRMLPPTPLASPAGGRTALAANSSGIASTPQALTAVTKVLPYLTVVIAAFAPLAGAVYLITSTGWSAAERHVFATRSARAAASQPEADAVGPGPQPQPQPRKRQAVDAAEASRAAERRSQTGAAKPGRSANSQPRANSVNAARSTQSRPGTGATKPGRSSQRQPQADSAKADRPTTARRKPSGKTDGGHGDAPLPSGS